MISDIQFLIYYTRYFISCSCKTILVSFIAHSTMTMLVLFGQDICTIHLRQKQIVLWRNCYIYTVADISFCSFSHKWCTLADLFFQGALLSYWFNCTWLFNCCSGLLFYYIVVLCIRLALLLTCCFLNLANLLILDDHLHEEKRCIVYVNETSTMQYKRYITNKRFKRSIF